MRQDQFESLQKRAEQLIDLFISESDPAKWPGDGVEPRAMEKQTRGDRYWCKKDAVATLACAQRIMAIVDVARAKTAGGEANPAAVTEEEDALDSEVAAAEAEAQALTDKLLRKAKQRDKLHGKP